MEIGWLKPMWMGTNSRKCGLDRQSRTNYGGGTTFPIKTLFFPPTKTLESSPTFLRTPKSMTSYKKTTLTGLSWRFLHVSNSFLLTYPSYSLCCLRKPRNSQRLQRRLVTYPLTPLNRSNDHQNGGRRHHH